MPRDQVRLQPTNRSLSEFIPLPHCRVSNHIRDIQQLVEGRSGTVVVLARLNWSSPHHFDIASDRGDMIQFLRNNLKEGIPVGGLEAGIDEIVV